MKKIALLFTICFLFALITAAQIPSRKVDNGKYMHEKRILNGIENGELIRRETRFLAFEQQPVKRTERKAELDGKVTRREKSQLDRKQERASRQLNRTKQNSEDMY